MGVFVPAARWEAGSVRQLDDGQLLHRGNVFRSFDEKPDARSLGVLLGLVEGPKGRSGKPTLARRQQGLVSQDERYPEAAFARRQPENRPFPALQAQRPTGFGRVRVPLLNRDVVFSRQISD